MNERAIVALLAIASARVAAADPTPDAARLYRDGQAAFDVGHYDDAIAAWEQSYDLSHAAALLYNIAQAYRLRAHDGDCAQARAKYQDFVRLSEPSPQHSLADGYIAQLATCAAFPPAQSVATAVVGQPRDTVRKQEAAIGVAGVGAVLFVTGLYFGHRAGQLGDDVTSACANSCDWTAEKEKDADGRRDATAGRVLDVIGALAIAGGATLFYLARRDSEIDVVPISSGSHETGVAVAWRHRW